jgi:hypothetical protein
VAEILDLSGPIKFRKHAVERMWERGITEEEVSAALAVCVKIEEDPMLVRGYTQSGRPLHVCFSIEAGTIYVITVYEPDPAMWVNGFTRRRN